jgi:hypothetical protein
MVGCYRLDTSVSGQGPLTGCCEHGNEPTGSIKCWEILEEVRDWWLLKKHLSLVSYLVSVTM